MQKLSELLGDWQGAKPDSLRAMAARFAAHPEAFEKELAARGIVKGKQRGVGHCPYNNCGGAGFIGFDVPYGHPNFGKAVPCQCTKDKAMQTSEQRLAEYQKQMSRTEQTYTLKNWIGSDEHAREAAQRAVAQAFGIKVFVGDYGVGKSGLLTAIVNTFHQRHIEARYCVLNKLLSELRAEYRTNDLASFDRALEALCSVRVLAIDELSAFKPTEWAENVLRTLIDERYRRWDELLTIIGTNELPDAESAIGSRLNDKRASEIIRVKGVDLRPLAEELSDEEDFWWTHADADAFGREDDERFAVVR